MHCLKMKEFINVSEYLFWWCVGWSSEIL